MTGPVEPPSRLLSGDHRGLDREFEEFQAAAGYGRDRRQEIFARFAAGLRRHIEVEERLLFPAFGEGDPSHRHLVDLMLDEHRRIEGILDRIRLRLETGPTSTEDLESELVNVLWAHNVREEGSVYPWFDTHLPEERIREVTRALRDPDPTGRAPEGL